jgi:lipoprotein-anchoring transpeptidase ErfK/SrfK
MARGPRYRLAAATRGGGWGCFWWLAAAVLLTGIVWVWLQHRPPATPPLPPPGANLPPTRPAPPPPVVAPLPNTNLVLRPVTPAPPPLPPPDWNQWPRPPVDVFEAQVALAREAISAGPIDGVMGSQTRAALRAFQQRVGLPETGELDVPTRGRLLLAAPPVTFRVIEARDLERLQPLSPTWLGKSQQTALEHETLLELVAEQAHTHPKLIRALNPGVDWDNVRPGQTVRVPDVAYPEPPEPAAWVRISLGARTLQVFDARSNLLAHFPCSIAARVEKRPLGELRVTALAPNPNYTFNPEVFPESAEARALGRKLILPPGPNNPVGTAWISLDRPGYGIHGTPVPEQVGRTESHGCFRLANWNAEYLLRMVTVGTPVFVEP